MSASSLRRSSARKGPTKSDPATSTSLLLTSIREIDSRSRRLSAVTKTRGCRSTTPPPLTRAAVSLVSVFVRRSPFEWFLFAAGSATCKVCCVPTLIVEHPPGACALRPIPNVVINDVLETHAFTSLMQFCRRAFFPPVPFLCLKPLAKAPFKSLGVIHSSPSWSRIGTKCHSPPQFGTTFVLLLSPQAGYRRILGI